MSLDSANSSFQLPEDEFDWHKYLVVRKAAEVPEDFFYHVCKSELNGIELDSVVEIENEDNSGYWFATVCSSKGVLINLHYLGDENEKHNFWLEVKSSRIHPLNWGSENNKRLVPPCDRFSRVNPKLIKEKVDDYENVVSKALLQMGGAPIFNVFKPEMFVEVQDKEYPYRVWVSKVLKNVGGRLFLQMQGESSPEKKPFWLFYSNERIFPLGWAEQKGLPWRVMNLETNFVDAFNSNLLLNVLKPKTPEPHTYKCGELLEVLNPYSFMIFHVGEIVKIYDNRYFKVEVYNEKDVDKRFTFVATKEHPYLFNAGWAFKHDFLLKPPSDWKKSDTFCWSEYADMKNAKIANVNNVCRRIMDNVHVNMKLEAVDPINPDIIRVATVKGFSDHWMFLSFDRTCWQQELLHVRSVYSDDIFPVGWCYKHKYTLSTPTLPYTNCTDFKNCYYVSDDDELVLNESDVEILENSPPYYIKGEILYHYEYKNKSCEIVVKSNQYLLNESDQCSDVTKKVDVNEPIKDIKDKSPQLDLEQDKELDKDSDKELNKELNKELAEELNKEVDEELEEELNDELDEEFHNELFLEKVDIKKKKKKVSFNITKGIVFKNPVNATYNMCIYFNKDCYFGTRMIKKKILDLPNRIGPGPVSKMLKAAITILINLDYFPGSALKKIKNMQHMLFDEPGGVETLISTTATKYHSKYSEYLILPESKKMAKKYCSALCNLSGICEYFMTSEETKCSRNCNELFPKFKIAVKRKATKKMDKRTAVSNSDSSNRRQIINKGITHVKKPNSSYFKNSNSSNILSEKKDEEIKQFDAIDINSSEYKNSSSGKRKKLFVDIAKIASKKLDWTNKRLVKRYNRYMWRLISVDAKITRLRTNPTSLELAITSEILCKKNTLKIMDQKKEFRNTKSDVEEFDEKNAPVFDEWKSSFENYYRESSKFKGVNINIGHFETIKVTSNPKLWASYDVYKYLSNDLYCRDIGTQLLNDDVDGVAFMLLNQEFLMNHLRCTINKSIRVMCHVAEAKYTFLTKYYEA